MTSDEKKRRKKLTDVCGNGGLTYPGKRAFSSMDPELNQEYDSSQNKHHRRQKLLAVELMQEFAQNTSLHGLKYITEKGLTLVEKLFWAATFLISISLCIVLIQNVWVKWQTSPVIVALSEQLVSVGEVPFPSVTICPQIKAKSSVYNFTQKTMEMKKKMFDFSPNETANEKPDPMTNRFEDIGLICWIERPMIWYDDRDHSDATVIKNIMEVSPNVDDVFRSCSWRDNSISCSDLFKPVLTIEGVCFTMNSMAANEIFREEIVQQDYFYLNTSKPSKNWSLKDGYNSSDDDAYPKKGRGNGANPDLLLLLKENTADRDGLCYGTNRGYKVYLHHPADVPQSSLYYYAALPKQTSSFALKFSVMNTSDSLINYPPETRQCYFPEERQLKYFRTYTPKNCRLECLSDYTFQKCGCVWFHMPYKDTKTICRELKRQCVMGALDRYAIEEGRTDSEAERCHCLPSCVGIQYDAEILKTEFDVNSYLNSAKFLFADELQNETDDDEGLLFTKIEMYYKEPRFVSMRRSELFGLTDFLANCGGLLGLFLGFSFLSLIEIFYFLTLRLGCTLRRDRRIDKNCIKQN